MAPVSFLATRTLDQLSKDEMASLPEAARTLSKDFYMDDIMELEHYRMQRNYGTI